MAATRIYGLVLFVSLQTPFTDTVCAQTILLKDFESHQATRETTPPVGWSFVDPTPFDGSYSSTTESNDAESNGGYAGQVTSGSFAPPASELPGAYIVHSDKFDPRFAWSGSFDARLDSGAGNGKSDWIFLFGDIGSGLPTSKNRGMTLKVIQNFGAMLSHAMSSSSNSNLVVNKTINAIAQSTWYRVHISWVPDLAGTATGTFSATFTNLATGNRVGTPISTSSFAFDSSMNSVQLGFGTLNDTASFDNVRIIQQLPQDVQAYTFFEDKIRPLLAQKCYHCHSAEEQNSGLRVDSLAALLTGGENGPALVPGSSETSLLVSAVRRETFDMPPDEPLSDEQVELLVKWVNQGAPWPHQSVEIEYQLNETARSTFIPQPHELNHWAFQIPTAAPLPDVNHLHWPRQPIDHFVLAKLEAHQLQPALPVDRLTLLRRATFDLTGLPPTPANIDSFLADDAPDSFVRVVDRLLASPHYGEQWGQHWLDVVRYADCLGGASNLPFANAHRYRDYVISALNRDKPFDRFIQEQIAGDLLPAGGSAVERDRLTAPGILQLGPYSNKAKIDVAAEQVSMITRALMGVNIACARCHDHPYEPLPTEDFYALAGIFTSIHSEEKTGSGHWFERTLTLPGGEQVKVLSAKDGTIKNLKVHHRGDADTLGHEVFRRFPIILAGNNQEPMATDRSGRLELSQWLTRSDTVAGTLNARVIVNRVWCRNFGVGLVRNPDNFGVSAIEGPSHPALLDWLAVRFIADGWSLKSLHRWTLLSSTYQQSSVSQNPPVFDPDNRLLWRQNRRRMEVEEIRDSILLISGQLELTMGGSLLATLGLGNQDDLTNKGRLQTISDHYGAIRQRTIYRPVVRGEMHLAEMMEIFDFPGREEVSGRRSTSTTAQQSLLMMNSPFISKHAKHTAQTILAEMSPDVDARVQQLYKKILGRPPQPEETGAALGYLKLFESQIENQTDVQSRQLKSWQSLTQAIFMFNEFVYID